jgi:hypothetical protein
MPPKPFVYVTVNTNVVLGVPLPGETPPPVRLTWPQVADRASVGAAPSRTDAPAQIVSANPRTSVVPIRRRCRPKAASVS